MTTQIKGDENKMPKEVNSLVPQSYKGMTLEEARVFLRSTMDLFHSLAPMTDLKTMYEAGKQLSRLYFDCSQHQRQLAEMLLELEFPEYAIKTMKKLNNMGVFKNDDIWFSSFYFYNICWNYSDASFEFATSLALCGLPNLLSLNIGHKPYLDNLSSRNVYYLIKASLSIIHNICRHPGSCLHFRSESVRASLRNLIDREEDFIRVVASLCLASVVGESEAVSVLGGGGADTNGGGTGQCDVLRSIVAYVRKARTSDRGRFMGFRSHELLQGVRAATATESGRRRFVLELDGLALIREGLKPPAAGSVNTGTGAASSEEEAAECLEIASNITVGGPEWRARLTEAGIDSGLARDFSELGGRMGAAGTELHWCLTSSTGHEDVLPEPDSHRDSTGVTVYVSHAPVNRFSAAKIRDRYQTDRPGLARVSTTGDMNLGPAATSSKMESGVRRAGLVLVCVSEAYKALPRCRLELETALRLGKPVLFVLVQQKYRADGWLSLAMASAPLHDLSSKRDFETAWETLLGAVGLKVEEVRRKQSAAAAAAQAAASASVKREMNSHQLPSMSTHEEPEEDMMAGGPHGGVPEAMMLEAGGGTMGEPLSTRTHNDAHGGYNARYNGEDEPDSTAAAGAGNTQTHTASLSGAVMATLVAVGMPKGGSGEGATRGGTSGVSADLVPWLEKHKLGHLAPRLGWLEPALLTRMASLRREAPEFFYNSIEKQLQLDLADLIRFARAMDELE